jgi:hypothetical protein
MARVAHNETDLVRPGEVHCGLDVGSAGGIDSVAHIVAELARCRLCRKGVAALVGKERLHDRRRRVQAVGGMSAPHECQLESMVQERTVCLASSMPAARQRMHRRHKLGRGRHDRWAAWQTAGRRACCSAWPMPQRLASWHLPGEPGTGSTRLWRRSPRAGWRHRKPSSLRNEWTENSGSPSGKRGTARVLIGAIRLGRKHLGDAKSSLTYYYRE